MGGERRKNMRRGEKEKRIGGDEKWRIEEEEIGREKAGKRNGG